MAVRLAPTMTTLTSDMDNSACKTRGRERLTDNPAIIAARPEARQTGPIPFGAGICDSFHWIFVVPRCMAGRHHRARMRRRCGDGIALAGTFMKTFDPGLR